jgi:hypothetical protein
MGCMNKSGLRGIVESDKYLEDSSDSFFCKDSFDRYIYIYIYIYIYMDNFVRTQLALMSPFLLRSLEFNSLLCNKKYYKTNFRFPSSFLSEGDEAPKNKQILEKEQNT